MNNEGKDFKKRACVLLIYYFIHTKLANIQEVPFFINDRIKLMDFRVSKLFYL